jgi:hypothetical protein
VTTPPGRLAYVCYFGGGVLPGPETVAGLIALLINGDAGLPDEAPKTGGPWQYRSFTDGEDGFEDELASYHPSQAVSATSTLGASE